MAVAIADLEGIWLEEIKAYSFSPTEIAAYIEKANNTVHEKEQLLSVQQAELQKAQRETTRVYQLYQDGQLDSAGFGKFYKPLEERAKQLGDSIPQLQAEIDVCKVNNLSAEEIASEVVNLHKTWPSLKPDEKRRIVEVIVEKITVGKGEITINLYYLPSCKDMAFGWRKGWDSNPR